MAADPAKSSLLDAASEAALRRGQERLEKRRAAQGVGASGSPSPLVPPSRRRDYSEIDSTLDEAEALSRTLGPSFRDTRLANAALVRMQLLRIEVGELVRRPKWFCFFRITDGPAEGGTILRGYNPPRRGQHVSPNHLIARDFVAITGLARVPPLPRRCRPETYLGAWLLDVELEAKTRRVTHQTVKNAETGAIEKVPHPEHAIYSVVDQIIGVTAGTPRILQRRRPSG